MIKMELFVRAYIYYNFKPVFEDKFWCRRCNEKRDADGQKCNEENEILL